jgi:hypothetical protein
MVMGGRFTMKMINKILICLGTAVFATGIFGFSAISNGNLKAVSATDTTVASFSRSGTTDTVSGGTLTHNLLSKSGYYQDNTTAQDYYLQLLNTTAWFSTQPAAINLSATLGGGATRASGIGMYAVLLNSSGSALGDPILLTDSISSTAGSSYSVSSFPIANWASVYGAKIYHTKVASYNVRYFSMSISWSDTFQQYLEIGTLPTKTTYKVGDTFDATGLVIRKYTSAGAYDNTVAYTTSPANGAIITSSDTTVTVTSNDVTVTGTTFALTLWLTTTQASALTDSISTSGTVLQGSYLVEGDVAQVVDSINKRFTLTDGTTVVYAYGYSSVSVTDLCVNGHAVISCNIGRYDNTYSTNGKAELSNLIFNTYLNPAETFADWMMDVSRDSETCSTKWATAKEKYATLGTEQKALFSSGSSVAIIVNARARYNAWAAANNDAGASSALVVKTNTSDDVLLIVVLSVLAFILAGGFVIIRKKHNA